SGGSREAVCAICENRFGAEDSLHCPAHGDTVCSLCCALDSDCGDRCRPGASLQAQTRRFLEAFLPGALVDRLHSTVGQFLVILALIATLTAGLFTLAYHALGPQTPDADTLVRGLLVQIFLLLTTVTGILVWLYVLAQESRRGALAASRQHTRRLAAEAAAHRRTAAELQAAKEEAVSANRAKSRYLSGVSHELRTPLNSLLGYAQLLEMDTGLSERNRQAAAVIRRSGEHLADIIEGLLDISKIEARRLDLHRGRIRLPALLDQLVEMFGVQARAKGLAFHYSVEGPIPPYVITDEKRLRQILMNLLSNAVKFTREGSVSLHLAYRSEVARFVIADTGVGIRPGDRERIFKPFERVRDEQTRAISGTGLGLAISRLLSTLMGGDLALESEPGRGSTFTLSILLPRAGEPEQPAAGKRRMTGYKGARRRVMVVDDEPSHRALITDALVPLGFRVSGASGGDAALRLARERGCDLYLLDVRMPDMDGWELARRLRSAGVTAPIIMLSGNAIEDHREQLTVPVHDGYLIKPIAIEDLREKIACLLSLEWTHRRETVEPGSPPAALEPPPRLAAGRPPESGELVELIGMARIGYLNGVIGELASLEKRGIDPAFIGELRAMALACNFDALVRSAAAGEGE
ncbi:MAG TPA: response regulator, partial [Sedimenticola sp.]|nr:response regulator [Sedimenticola sp.]